MSTANLDAADLAAVAVDGLINEEVMQKIWDIDPIDLKFTNAVGAGSVGNARFSWTQDENGAIAIDDQVVDGADTDTIDDTATGDRVQNFCETRVKVVPVSTRAQSSNTIGFANALAYQVMKRQKDLRRNVEATALSNNSSVADDGNTTPGRTGALDAWLQTNTSNGATGSDGGFNFTTGLVDASTPGTSRPLNEAIFKDLLQSVFENSEGGDNLMIVCRPSVTRKFSEYQFTAGARVATLTRETASSDSPTDSLGAVNVYIGDFNTVRIYTSREQQPTAANQSTMFILDPALLELVYLSGYRTEALAKTGLSDKRQVSVDWGLRVGNEKGCAAFRAIDETADMVAGP